MHQNRLHGLTSQRKKRYVVLCFGAGQQSMRLFHLMKPEVRIFYAGGHVII
jgi:hypothetical protein